MYDRPDQKQIDEYLGFQNNAIQKLEEHRPEQNTKMIRMASSMSLMLLFDFQTMCNPFVRENIQ